MCICLHHLPVSLVNSCGENPGNSPHQGGNPKHIRQHLLLFYIPVQVEFYFGDANLPKDKFLQQKMLEDPDGCEYMYIVQVDLKYGMHFQCNTTYCWPS